MHAHLWSFSREGLDFFFSIHIIVRASHYLPLMVSCLLLTHYVLLRLRSFVFAA